MVVYGVARQEWSEIGNLVEDFSVTTNGLGPVPGALEAAKEALLSSVVNFVAR